MMTESESNDSDKTVHKNQERVVECPACGAEKVARGINLHVLQSDGNGHGPKGDVPESMDLDSLETVGTQTVSMEYPDERDSEQVKRLCPYCKVPFHGKHGVMIHLGQVAGRKDHPDDASEPHDPDDFAIVHVDDNDNVVEVIEEGVEVEMPSARRRRDEDDVPTGSVEDLDPETIRDYIDSLREQGKEKEVEKMRAMFFGDEGSEKDDEN